MRGSDSVPVADITEPSATVRSEVAASTISPAESGVLASFCTKRFCAVMFSVVVPSALSVRVPPIKILSA